MPSYPMYIVLGKIIIDEILGTTGIQNFESLGGGGPQAAFGAQLWCKDGAIGLISPIGKEEDDSVIKQLSKLSINIEGVQVVPGLQTPRARISYDKNELKHWELINGWDNWLKVLTTPLVWPENYEHAMLIHTIVETLGRVELQQAIEYKKEHHCILSIEPIFDSGVPLSAKDLITYCKHADIICPDWRTATLLRDSQDPVLVLDYWRQLGPTVVAIRHGRFGSYVWAASSDGYWHIPPLKVATIDPTGAGNAYAASLAITWHLTKDIIVSACCATISASAIIQKTGTPALTSELQSWVRNQVVPLRYQVVRMDQQTKNGHSISL